MVKVSGLSIDASRESTGFITYFFIASSSDSEMSPCRIYTLAEATEGRLSIVSS